MKLTLPNAAVEMLKEILNDNQDKPSNIRVYFSGNGCCGPSFGLALDEKKDTDLTYETNDLIFIMAKEEYDQYGDIVIENTGYGFRVAPENMEESSGCGGGCSGCGQ